jgi:periplasmic protein TonB
MTAIATYRQSDDLKTFLWYSLAFHAALGLVGGISYLFPHKVENWGSAGGGSVKVGIVGSVPAIPLPRPEIETPSRVVDETKGLYKAEPPEIKTPPPDAIPIPKFPHLKPPPPAKTATRTPPPKDTHPSKILENPIPPPPNAVPYGKGGTPTVPVTSFAMGAGTAQAGLSFNGPSGNGDFGSKFPWYVEAVQRRISGNWLQSTVDANVGWAPRVVVTFDILRDGTITNVQVTQSSNNYSVDSSAVRAVHDSSKLSQLPPGYAGSSVGVEFWFDYKRQ